MKLFPAEEPIHIHPEKTTCVIGKQALPAVGFGTYTFTGEVCKQAVISAIDIGYKIIDTATFYENFQPIGEVLKGTHRDNFYLISKVWHDKLTAKDVHHDLEKTLKALQVDYLDLYLVHWPNSTIPISETLSAMNELRQQGKIRHIGLSNVTVNHLKKALKVGVPISWIQVEMHPFYYDPELLIFCREHRIAVQAWRPLDLGRVKDDALLKEIGDKYGKTTCQVALRWILQHQCLPLPGSKSPKHQKENFEIADFTLTEDEMKILNNRAVKGARFRLNSARGLGFSDEFDFTYDECWPNG